MSVHLLLPSFIYCLFEVTFFYLISLCNFLLLSLAAKGKKNIARSLCNFLLLSLAAKGNKKHYLFLV